MTSRPHRLTISLVVLAAAMLLLPPQTCVAGGFAVGGDDSPLIDVDSITPERTNSQRRSAATRRMAARLLLGTLPYSNDAMTYEPLNRNYFFDYGKPGRSLIRKRVETEPVSASRLAGMLQGLRTRQGDGVKLDTLRFGK